MNDARPFFFKIYVDGFYSPDHIVRTGPICDQIIEGLLSGDFWKVEGTMINGQRFIMRRKRPHATEIDRIFGRSESNMDY